MTRENRAITFARRVENEFGQNSRIHRYYAVMQAAFGPRNDCRFKVAGVSQKCPRDAARGPLIEAFHGFSVPSAHGWVEKTEPAAAAAPPCAKVNGQISGKATSGGAFRQRTQP